MILQFLVTDHERRCRACEPSGTPDYPYRLAYQEGARGALQDVLQRVEAMLRPEIARPAVDDLDDE